MPGTEHAVYASSLASTCSSVSRCRVRRGRPFGGDDGDRVLRAVERRTRHLGHAGVELGEYIAVAARVDDVDAGGDHHPGIGDQVRSRLELEMEPPAGALLELDECFAHG